MSKKTAAITLIFALAALCAFHSPDFRSNLFAVGSYALSEEDAPSGATAVLAGVGLASEALVGVAACALMVNPLVGLAVGLSFGL